jgi:GntR family transcriptional repressor for pyruvate dehydrogenase complex
MFTPVARQQSLTERAAAQLERVIVEGSFRVGDRLPPERKLAEMIGVSRTVIREALRLLASKRLLEVRTGAGIFVNAPGTEIVSEPINLLLQTNGLSPEEVHEVRTELEIRIAGLAAERATESDYPAIEEAIQTLARRGLTTLEYANSDAAFHLALAKASHNRLFAILLSSLNDCLKRTRLAAFGDPHTRERALFHHIAILEQIRAKNVQAARDAMEQHLLAARQECYRGLTEP